MDNPAKINRFCFLNSKIYHMLAFGSAVFKIFAFQKREHYCYFFLFCATHFKDDKI